MLPLISSVMLRYVTKLSASGVRLARLTLSSGGCPALRHEIRDRLPGRTGDHRPGGGISIIVLHSSSQKAVSAMVLKDIDNPLLGAVAAAELLYETPDKETGRGRRCWLRQPTDSPERVGPRPLASDVVLCRRYELPCASVGSKVAPFMSAGSLPTAHPLISASISADSAIFDRSASRAVVTKPWSIGLEVSNR